MGSNTVVGFSWEAVSKNTLYIGNGKRAGHASTTSDQVVFKGDLYMGVVGLDGVLLKMDK